MSSDKSQTQVGGTVASVGQMGAREGGLSAAQKRVAVDNASVSVRLKDDKGEALDAALTDSTFMAKTDGDLKNLSGIDLLTEMINNPLTQCKSGTAWAQTSIARAGLGLELDKLIEGCPVVEERQCYENIKNIMASCTLPEMSKIQVQSLQQSMERVGLFSGKIDGDFSNPGLVAGLDRLAHKEKTIERSMKGGTAMLDFVWAMRNTEPKLSKAEPAEESATLKMFKANRAEITATPVAMAAITAPRPQELRPSV